MDRGNIIAVDTILAPRVDFRKIDKLEPEWFYRLCKEAWESYNDSPLPLRTSNVWRYTDPANFVIPNPETLLNLRPVLPGISLDNDGLLDPGYAAFGRSDEDGQTLAQMLPELKSAGVIFKDLFSAVREHPDIVEGHLGGLIGKDFGKFEALNLALWNTGLFIYVPDNLAIEKPIYLHRHPTGQFTFPRLLAVLGKNVSATIIDDHACHCHRERPMLNGAVEMFVGDSSNVRYVNVQRLSPDFRTYMTERIEIGQDANLNSIFGSVGSSIAKFNAGSILNGRGANSRMEGIVFGNEKQHFDYHTSQHHKASGSFSNLDFKVVMKDDARSVYTGLIRIEKDTANCEAYQENRNLLLNSGAKADSIPELEILTDQVRCTHGATMGPIDPEMIFYLRSRGLDENGAIKAVVSGFVEPMLDKMPAHIARRMKELVRNKLMDVGYGRPVH